MKLAREWDGVERRKTRPSKDSIIELLNRFGTEYPEPEPQAAALRKQYYDLLARPWPARAKGLPHIAVSAVTVVLAACVFLMGGFILILLSQSGAENAGGISLFSLFLLGLWGILLFGAMLYILSMLNINTRTRAHTFRKFPLVRKAARRLADPSREETVRDYIPLLRIDGKTFFQIVYVKKGDRSQTPTGILLLDEQGRVVFKFGVLENAKLTASVSIICGHALQQRAQRIRRSMKNVVTRQIPEAVVVLKSQERRFSERRLSPRLASVLEGAGVLPQALQESITILDAEEAFRRAMGYAFALEFHHEDARKLRELYVAYVKYMNAAFRRKIIALTTEAAMLIGILETKTDWEDRDAALAALSTLAVAGTSGFLSRVFQKEYEGIVDVSERRAYEAKTMYAKNRGSAVLAE